MNTEISFREMIHGEETEVVDLVLNVFSEFVAPHFSEDGILEFKKFGFKGENVIKTVDGIRFIPMELELGQWCRQPTVFSKEDMT